MTAPQLDVYDIAHLAGGPERVVDTALVALAEEGRITVQPPGRLAVVEPTRRHPVEGAVLDAVGTRGDRSVDVVRWRLADDDRVLAIGRRLTAAGLVRRWSVVPRRAERPVHLTPAGRRALAALAAEPPSDPAWDGGTAVLVALHGRDRLSDELRRSSMFEPIPVPTAKERAAGLRRRLDAVRTYHPGGPMGGGGGGDGGG
ncbi:TIGR04222 domain-containing membrane protein [Blastococcus sp. SYSU D00922]